MTYLKTTQAMLWYSSKSKIQKMAIQIPTRIPEKIVVAMNSGVLVNSGILVVA